MNAGIGTVAAQFLFREYLFRIFGIVSLQCIDKQKCRWRDKNAREIDRQIYKQRERQRTDRQRDRNADRQ